MWGCPKTYVRHTKNRQIGLLDRKKTGRRAKEEKKKCFWITQKRGLFCYRVQPQIDGFIFFLNYSLLLAAMETPFPAAGQASESVAPTGEIMSLFVHCASEARGSALTGPTGLNPCPTLAVNT